MQGGTQIYVPTLTRLNKIIIIVAAVSFLAIAIMQKLFAVSLVHYLSLTPNMVFDGHLYQLITYPIIQGGLMSTIFDALIIWFIGSELESNWGERKYSLFLLSSIAAAALFYLIVGGLFTMGNMPMYGITGLAYSLLLAYAVIYPDRILTFMLIFPMKAKYFCAILIGILLFSGLMSEAASAWGQLGAMIGGFGYMYGSTYLKRNKAKVNRFQFKSKSKANLYIVKDDEEKRDNDDPKYFQ